MVVGFCSTVVFLVDDWMTAPTWRGVGRQVRLDSCVLGGRLDDGPDVERGWLFGLVVPLSAMRGWLFGTASWGASFLEGRGLGLLLGRSWDGLLVWRRRLLLGRS